MESTKWRLAKACEECRAKKIRCDGSDPCRRCRTRAVDCVYRAKARNRASKNSAAPAQLANPELLDRPSGEDGNHASTRGLQNHSVAATHRATPAMLLQLYYGPSSNFSIMNFIYHQIEGTRPDMDSDQQREVQEMGPGLDRFNLRKLYFGDLADSAESRRMTNDTAAMLVDRDLASSLLERYLSTYWHIMPIWSKDEYRRQLARLYVPSQLFSFENPDSVIVLLAMAMGAAMLEEEAVAQFLFQKAKRWSSRYDEMVNVQAVQMALLMSHFHAERARPNSAFLMAGIAVRKAVGAGLHKDITGNAQSSEDTRQRRITIWSVFSWETWLCFSLGRPSSFPESEMRVPLPAEEKFLHALASLARLVSKCATHLYKQQHASLGPVWSAANEIRRDLLRFAEQQRRDLHFALTGEPSTGELGICQVIISTMYHHTMILTFRPFLVLRAKMRQEITTSSRSRRPTPPPWLDMACKYCMDATRQCISFLATASEQNVLCREIKYHAFFIEGASHVLLLDMLQDKTAGRADLPCLLSAIYTLRSMWPRSDIPARPVDLAENLERLAHSIYPDFRVSPAETTQTVSSAPTNNFGFNPERRSLPPLHPDPSGVPSLYAPSSTTSRAATVMPEDVEQQQPGVLTPGDGGWNFDFATTDMEAFLSIDPSLDPYQLALYPS